MVNNRMDEADTEVSELEKEEMKLTQTEQEKEKEFLKMKIIRDL